MSDLPDAWFSALLVEIAFIQMGQSPESRSYNNIGDGLPFFQGKAEFGKLFPIVRKWCTEPKKIAEEGDILLSVRAPVGPTNLAVERCCIGRGLSAIRADTPISQKYLLYYFRNIEAWLAQQGTGSTFAAVSGDFVRELEIPLAPLNEQKRIADKLDALLARVDACRERLDRLPLILKRFRQAILAAATSGELTEDWRKDQINIGTWEDTTVGVLIDGIEAGVNVQCEERPPHSHERGLVKISAVTWGTYNDRESKTLPPSHNVPESTRIQVGDFLISRANTLELVGACVLVEKVTRPVFLSDKVLRLVMKDSYKKWLLFWLRSENGRYQIEHLASGNQLSMRNLSQSNLKSISLKLPCNEELEEIVLRVETLFAFVDRLENRYKTARVQVEQLTPTLLAKAFRGELVPQDSNDEPASVLLERIRAARVVAEEDGIKPERRKLVSDKPPKTKVIMLIRKDVQPTHLSSILRTRGPLTAKDLWSASQLEIDDFYDQLRDEEANGLLRERGGEASNTPRLLEAA